MFHLRTSLKKLIQRPICWWSTMTSKSVELSKPNYIYHWIQWSHPLSDNPTCNTFPQASTTTYTPPFHTSPDEYSGKLPYSVEFATQPERTNHALSSMFKVTRISQVNLLTYRQPTASNTLNSPRYIYANQDSRLGKLICKLSCFGRLQVRFQISNLDHILK